MQAALLNLSLWEAVSNFIRKACNEYAWDMYIKGLFMVSEIHI